MKNIEEKFGKVIINGVVLYNTTPHPINLITPIGSEIRIPGAQKPLRLKEEREVIGDIAPGIMINKVKYSPEGVELPAPSEGVYYIVSAVVAARLPREDFLITDEAVRDEEGRIIGCRAFAKV